MLKETLRVIPDFPKQGIMFSDICPVIKNPFVFNRVIEEFALLLKDV